MVAALPQACTRLGNGTALLSGVDGRSAGARRYKEIVTDLCLEMTNMMIPPTAIQVHLAKRAAFLIIWCERTEAEISNSDAVKVAEYIDVTNALRRILTDASLIFPPYVKTRM